MISFSYLQIGNRHWFEIFKRLMHKTSILLVLIRRCTILWANSVQATLAKNCETLVIQIYITHQGYRGNNFLTDNETWRCCCCCCWIELGRWRPYWLLNFNFGVFSKCRNYFFNFFGCICNHFNLLIFLFCDDWYWGWRFCDCGLNINKVYI